MKKLIALMCFTALLCGCSSSKSSSEESSSEAKDIAPVTEAVSAVSDDEYEKNAADESWREIYKEKVLSLKDSPEYKENIYFLSRKFPANADSFIASHFLLRYNAFKA